jgi:hypothetical protein
VDVADVTDAFTVNDSIAVTYGEDEIIGGSVAFIILQIVGISFYQWMETIVLLRP